MEARARARERKEAEANVRGFLINKRRRKKISTNNASDRRVVVIVAFIACVCSLWPIIFSGHRWELASWMEEEEGEKKRCLSCNFSGTISHQNQFWSDINDDRGNRRFLLLCSKRVLYSHPLSMRNLYLRIFFLQIERDFLPRLTLVHLYVVVREASLVLSLSLCVSRSLSIVSIFSSILLEHLRFFLLRRRVLYPFLSMLELVIRCSDRILSSRMTDCMEIDSRTALLRLVRH